MANKIKMYGFDIREELDVFRSGIMKKHPNLIEEVIALERRVVRLNETYSDMVPDSIYESSVHSIQCEALALKEMILKIRIEPGEANFKFLINKLDALVSGGDE